MQETDRSDGQSYNFQQFPESYTSKGSHRGQLFKSCLYSCKGDGEEVKVEDNLVDANEIQEDNLATGDFDKE